MAQLKDLIVNGDAVFGGNVTLDHDPTTALQAATKQYVDNNSGDVVVFSTHDYQASITTPTTTGYDISGTITSGTYNAIMDAINNSKVPILIDDEGDFDYDNGVIRTYYYNSHDVNASPAYIQLVSLPDNDANSDEIWSLCILSGDTFGIKKASLGGAQIWGKSANNGVYYPLTLDSTNINDGSIVIGMQANAGGVPNIVSTLYSNFIIMSGNSVAITGAVAGSTSYSIANASGWALGDGSVEYAKQLLFYSEKAVGAQSPTAVSLSGTTLTLTFASSLNPSNSATNLWYGSKSQNAGAVLIGAGISANSQSSYSQGNRVVNNGSYSLTIGQNMLNSGGASISVGTRNNNGAAQSAIFGDRNVNAKQYAFLAGRGHDSTSGTAGVAAVGIYSSIDNDSAFVVGNGTADNARSNAFEVHSDGRATVGATPVNNMDVATKKYVDDNAGGGGGTPATSVTAVDTTAVVGTSTNYARQDHVHNIALATGTNNGQVKIAGTDVSVKGLGANAYTDYTVQLKRCPVKSSDYDPIVSTLISTRRANRLCFLPADQIIAETTTDGGTTWVSAGLTDAQKLALFSERRQNVAIPLIDGKANINCGIRFTITGMKYNVPSGTAETAKYNYWNSSYVNQNYTSQERYCTINGFYFWVQAVNRSLSLKVEGATGGAPTTWKSFYDSELTTANNGNYKGSKFGLTGWSGGDYVPLSQHRTFGGSYAQTDNFWNWRLTFFTRDASGDTGDLPTSSITTANAIYEIRAYGDAWYTTISAANNFMANDHLYRPTATKDAEFPAKVNAIGGLQENGTDISSLYDNTPSYVIEAPNYAYVGSTTYTGDATVFTAAKTAMQAGKKVYLKIRAEQIEGTLGSSNNWTYHLLSGYHESGSVEAMAFMWGDYFNSSTKQVRVLFQRSSGVSTFWNVTAD